jgi:hypothetical protein
VLQVRAYVAALRDADAQKRKLVQHEGAFRHRLHTVGQAAQGGFGLRGQSCYERQP